MTNCTLPWGIFKGDVSGSLLSFFIFYCCVICIIGIISNAFALWNVITCSKTCTPIKVILCALFSTMLLMCLVVMPIRAHFSLMKLWCATEKSMTALYVSFLISNVLTIMEVFYIVVMALLRARAVWSPSRRQTGLCTAIAVTVGIALYSTSLMILMLVVKFWEKTLSKPTLLMLDRMLVAVHLILPMLLILVCYLYAIVAVRRNKRHLATMRHTEANGQVLDRTTRAMLAVFISSLLFGLPHSIFHILPPDLRDGFSSLIVHMVFFTHLYADPLVFLCFKARHWRRVLHSLRIRLSPHTQVASPPSSETTAKTSTQNYIEEGQVETLI